MGKQKSVKKRKLPDIKSLIFGNGHKENTVIFNLTNILYRIGKLDHISLRYII